MSDLPRLAELLMHRRVVALTGAGCSTESGIPDYRGPTTRDRARNPMQAREFRQSAEARQRYWARSVVGFERIAAARPNPAHHALAGLERDGWLIGVITQNVDGLHQAAGSRRVVELHGALSRVQCLSCQARSSRARLQELLLEKNPDLRSRHATIAPDGDAELGEFSSMQVVDCDACGGVLKPDVVFFGENVRPDVLEQAWQCFDQADALLVVGSSLAVFSGFRFVRRAAQRELPIAIVNLGPTRGDPLATVHVQSRAGELLPALCEQLRGAQLHPPTPGTDPKAAPSRTPNRP